MSSISLNYIRNVLQNIKLKIACGTLCMICAVIAVQFPDKCTTGHIGTLTVPRWLFYAGVLDVAIGMHYLYVVTQHNVDEIDLVCRHILDTYWIAYVIGLTIWLLSWPLLFDTQNLKCLSERKWEAVILCLSWVVMTLFWITIWLRRIIVLGMSDYHVENAYEAVSV